VGQQNVQGGGLGLGEDSVRNTALLVEKLKGSKGLDRESVVVGGEVLEKVALARKLSQFR